MYGGEDERVVWWEGRKECIEGKRKGVFSGEEERSVWWGGGNGCMGKG